MADRSGDVESIRVLQRLLAATCCDLDDDGVWGPRTDEAVEAFRSILGLGTGGLDTALWEAVFALDAPSNFEWVDGVEGTVKVPRTAVLLERRSEPLQATYTLAHYTEMSSLRNWYGQLHEGVGMGPWDWCKSTQTGDDGFEFVWWQRSSGVSSPLLELRAVDLGSGRVDLVIGETSGAVDTCDGYAEPPPTTNAPPPEPSGSDEPDSSDAAVDPGVTAGCYVGMNLESCEDALGAGLGDRLITLDCTGQGRTVLWARNWWIIDSYDGVPIISKDQFSCA